MGYCCREGTAVGNTADEEDTGFEATVSEQEAEGFERIGKGEGNARCDVFKDEEKDLDNGMLLVL